jgi:hypothetical protein
MILTAAIDAVLRVRIGRGLEHRADRWVVGELADRQRPQPVGVLDDKHGGAVDRSLFGVVGHANRDRPRGPSRQP